MDEQKLEQFLNQFVGDLGATIAAGGVVIGEQLGLYRALAERPQSPEELAAATGTGARYVAEWLRGQAAGGYVQYDARTGTFSMTAEQVFALTDPEGPVFLPGAFQLALGALRAVPQLVEAFRTSDGVGWHEHDEDVFVGIERFFRPGYAAHLVTEWLPALEGVVAKLDAGARVADIGCGLGASTLLMAQAFPNSTFHGSDYHAHSVDLARKRAAEVGAGTQVDFEVAGATDFGGGPFDLVTSFDCLHDMGDPVGAARRVREQLAEDGTWLLVEPMSADTVEGNLNPVGRMMYGFSTFLCVPNALSQGGTHALGAQAGQAAIRQVTEEAGFTRFREVARTPFNRVSEVRR